MVRQITDNKIYTGTNTEIRLKETSHRISKWGIAAFSSLLISPMTALIFSFPLSLAFPNSLVIVLSPLMVAGGVVVVTEAIAISMLIHQYKQMSELKKKCNQS